MVIWSCLPWRGSSEFQKEVVPEENESNICWQEGVCVSHQFDIHNFFSLSDHWHDFPSSFLSSVSEKEEKDNEYSLTRSE